MQQSTPSSSPPVPPVNPTFNPHLHPNAELFKPSSSHPHSGTHPPHTGNPANKSGVGKAGRMVSKGKTANKTAKRFAGWQVAPTFWASLSYAWSGVVYTFATQRNFRIHLCMGSLALGLALVLDLEAVRFAVIGLTIGLVLTLELLNTAIEAVVDLAVGDRYHELAKVAKDCAAGAVLMSAIASLVVAVALLLPPLLERLFSVWS